MFPIMSSGRKGDEGVEMPAFIKVISREQTGSNQR